MSGIIGIEQGSVVRALAGARLVLFAAVVLLAAAGCGGSPAADAGMDAADRSDYQAPGTDAGPTQFWCTDLHFATPGVPGDFDGNGCPDLALASRGGIHPNVEQGYTGEDVLTFYGDRFTSVALAPRLVGSGREWAVALGDPREEAPGGWGEAGSVRIVEVDMLPWVKWKCDLDYPGSWCPSAIVRLDGAGLGDHFGTAVAGVGDVDEDGREDLAVGVPRDGAGGGGPGEVHLFFDVAASPPVSMILSGLDAAERFGSVLAWVGDLDDDGSPDVVVGAPGAPVGSSAPGLVYVYRGGPALDDVADAVLVGAAPGDRFGASLAGLGDADGDGVVDLAVGAPGSDAAGADAGRVYVFLGGATFDGVPDLILDGPGPGERYGEALAGIGDFDGDGLGDLAVGAPGDGTTTGRLVVLGALLSGPVVHVDYGGPVYCTAQDPKCQGGQMRPSIGLGTGVGGGDLDLDGYADVVAIASGWGGEGSVRFRGGPSGPSPPEDCRCGTRHETLAGPGARAFFAPGP